METPQVNTSQQPAPAVDRDPVLSASGLGRRLWETESGDAFVERLRSEDLAAPEPMARSIPDPLDRVELIWQRIQAHQEEEFQTATGLPFTYKVDGSGLWIFRGGRRINRRLPKKQVAVAIERCPLKSTTEIKDLMGLSYLFGILTDRRIRGNDW
ncbi:MAG: hypothetical protein K6T61_13625 [Bryobacteraceae bacterium]|nr:hypothetical protein [Bryobacteraceae bacterium]